MWVVRYIGVPFRVLARRVPTDPNVESKTNERVLIFGPVWGMMLSH